MSKKISPQGYVYGSDPLSEHPFWDDEEDGDGATFIPTLTPFDDETGKGYILSWTNDKDLPNPDPVKIFDGTNGEDGEDGVTPSITASASVSATGGAPACIVTKTGTDADPNFAFAFSGIAGANGVTFTPHLSTVQNGHILSWTNNGGLPNPSSVLIANGSDAQTPTVALHGYWINPDTGDEVDVVYSKLQYLEVNPQGDNLTLYFQNSDYEGIVSPDLSLQVRSVPYYDTVDGTDDGKILKINSLTHAPEWAKPDDFTLYEAYNSSTIAQIVSSSKEFYINSGFYPSSLTQASSWMIVLDEMIIKSLDGTTLNRKISASDIISLYYRKQSGDNINNGTNQFTIHGFHDYPSSSMKAPGIEIMDSWGYFFEAVFTISDPTYTDFDLRIPLVPVRCNIETSGPVAIVYVFFGFKPGVATISLQSGDVDVEVLPCAKTDRFNGEVLKLSLPASARVSYKA